MREQEVGTGVTFPSVKKGMVAPVDTQNMGAEASGRPCPGGRAAPGDMLTGCPKGSCWEWLLVGISSLATPPAQMPSSGSSPSSAGGALGVTPAAPGAPVGAESLGLDGDMFTAMFPMQMGSVTTASGDFSDTCRTNGRTRLDMMGTLLLQYG